MKEMIDDIIEKTINSITTKMKTMLQTIRQLQDSFADGIQFCL